MLTADSKLARVIWRGLFFDAIGPKGVGLGSGGGTQGELRRYGGDPFAPAVRALFGELFGELLVRSSDTFQSAASGLALIAAGRTGMPRQRKVMEE